MWMIPGDTFMIRLSAADNRSLATSVSNAPSIKQKQIDHYK